ncbi:hypothetical protein KSP39_PZI002051 [Platanthera zijinensis]|uniref:Uncharacterized protein n=1 Tax=Platanthera zijinensis TaxID=2320716 RepID=A0AAP0BY43_9ASPA
MAKRRWLGLREDEWPESGEDGLRWERRQGQGEERGNAKRFINFSHIPITIFVITVYVSPGLPPVYPVKGSQGALGTKTATLRPENPKTRTQEVIFYCNTSVIRRRQSGHFPGQPPPPPPPLRRWLAVGSGLAAGEPTTSTDNTYIEIGRPSGSLGCRSFAGLRGRNLCGSELGLCEELICKAEGLRCKLLGAFCRSA